MDNRLEINKGAGGYWFQGDSTKEPCYDGWHNNILCDWVVVTQH